MAGIKTLNSSLVELTKVINEKDVLIKDLQAKVATLLDSDCAAKVTALTDTLTALQTKLDSQFKDITDRLEKIES